MSPVGLWRTSNAAVRDAIKIAAAMAIIWYFIERTELCDAFFQWVAANPDSELDSLLLVALLTSFGVTAFAVRRYREAKAAVEAQREAEAEAHALAYLDGLTGLPNRQALTEDLDRQVQAGANGSVGAHLMIVDLDRFKHVNDVHGHHAGDRLLVLVAERLLTCLPQGASAYRLGGDEFAVLLPHGVGDDDAAERCARQIVGEIGEPYDSDGLVHHIGCSIGIGAYPMDAASPQTLMRCADVALYRAKDSGRGTYRRYRQEMGDAILERSQIEREMRQSVLMEEFEPYYQPLVDLASRRIIGFEMLARWPRAVGKQVGPDVFIAIAEESGLINDLFLSLLERACRDMRAWDPGLTLAVNISPVQLRDPLLAQKLLASMARNGFAPGRLTVEITENAIIADADGARRTIDSLKNQGVDISLDDFGTGYSSLHHLRMLPFDKIKIDRSFVMQIAEDVESQKIVRAIAGLANSLDLPVVAEGIETEEAARRALELGCTQGQGYYFGKAMTAIAAMKVLAAQSRTPDAAPLVRSA